MKAILVTTSYLKDGNIEFFSRAYLPTADSGAQEQAREWCGDTWGSGWYDSGTLPRHAEIEITPALLRESYPEREDLILATARICALEAISAGAPAILAGSLFGDWSKGKDAQDGDYDLLGEVAGACSPEEIDLFSEGYLKELFHESACEDGPAPEPTAEEKEEIALKGANDGIAEVENVLCEQGIEVLRDCQKPSCLDWDNAARNAGAFEISLPRWEESQEARDLYYAAYAKAADERADEILKESEESEAA